MEQVQGVHNPRLPSSPSPGATTSRILPGLTLAAGVPGWQYNLLPPLMDGNPGTVFL